MLEAPALGLDAELAIALAGRPIQLDVVHEGDRVQAEVGQRRRRARRDPLAAVHGVLDQRRAVRQRRMALVDAAARAPDVGRVVGADRGADPAVAEHAFADQALEIADREQHHVEDVLAHQRRDLVEIVAPGLEGAARAALGVAPRARHRDAAAHVAVLGIADQKVPGALRVLADPRELLLQPGGDHASAPIVARADPNPRTRG